MGKTELSIDLARHLNGQIISADSMQVYRGMDIGTAKITPSEMQGVRHYLIDELDPDQEFNVYVFQNRATQYIRQILQEGMLPMIVGGTGFYIQSVLYDIDFTQEETNRQYRAELEALAEEQGRDRLWQMLREVDPEAAAQIHAHNVKRVIRALEFYHDTGTRISQHNQEQRARASAYRHAYIVLNRERSVLYERINRRVDIMLRDGLVEEVHRLLAQGVSPSSVAMQGLGYKEIVSYLQGEISLSEAAELIKRNTRHFAKRQITWFRREKDVIWVNIDDDTPMETVRDRIIQIAKEKQIVPLS